MIDQLLGVLAILLAFGATVVGAAYVFAITADREQQSHIPGDRR